jgi:hypothetical protein
MRFRRVSTLYSRLVALAYDGDISAAAADDDARVADRVAAWELREHGSVTDWAAVGRTERDEDPR